MGDIAGFEERLKEMSAKYIYIYTYGQNLRRNKNKPRKSNIAPEKKRY